MLGSVSHRALASCDPPNFYGGIECNGDDDTVSSNISITNGGQSGNAVAPGVNATLPGATATDSINAILNRNTTTFAPSTPGINGILVTPDPGEEQAAVTYTGTMSNSIDQAKIIDNAAKVQTTITVTVQNGITPAAGTVTTKVTDNAGNVYTETRPATAAEMLSARTSSSSVVSPSSAAPNTARTYTLTQSATFTSQANVANVRGIDTEDDGAYSVTNKGKIFVSHAGVGQAYGIAGNGDVESLEVKNSNTIDVTRGPLNLTRVRSNSVQATPTNIDALHGYTLGTALAAQNLQVAAGIFAEEELASLSVTNDQGARITVHGLGAVGVYSRAGEFDLVNNGTIESAEATAAAQAVSPAYGGKGIAIAAVSDSDEIRTAKVTNNGTINGDLLFVNAHALRWWLLSNGYGTAVDVSATGVPNASVSKFDSRLYINSQFGQLDSTVVNNEGATINGNLYYSNGTHVLENHGTIHGNLDVDQRDTFVRGASCTLGATSDGEPACFPASTTASDLNKATAFPLTGEPSPNSVSEITALTNATSPGAPSVANDSQNNTAAAVAADLGLTLTSSVTATYSTTIFGTKDFTLEQDGTLQGDVTVRTAAAGFVQKQGGGDLLDGDGNTIATPGSKVTLVPHIYGGGGDKADAANSDASAFIDGTLKVYDPTTGNSTLSSTTTIDPTIESLVRSGEWYTVATNVFINGTDTGPQAEDTVLVHWNVATDAGPGGNALAVEANVQAAGDVVPGLSAPGVTTLNALMNTDSDNDDLLALGGAIQNIKDEEEVRRIGEQLKPDVTYGTIEAARTMNFLTGQYIDQRLAGVGATGGGSSKFSPAYGLGMQTASVAADTNRMSLGVGDDGRMNVGATYDDETGAVHGLGRGGMWGQMFGAGLEQDARQGVDGYGAHVYGGLVGVDNWIAKDVRFGLAGGYGRTNIENDGFTKGNETEIDSYLALFYGAVKGNGWYASGRAGYAWDKYQSSRTLVLPASGDDEDAGPQKFVANGKHDANQYMAALEVGAPLHWAAATVTPVASLTWTRLEQTGYQESGINGFTIGAQDSDSLQSGLGVKVLAPLEANLLIEGRAIWYHEFEDTNQQVTAAFADASSFTVAGPDVGRDTANLGVGLLAYIGYGSTFQLNYDALIRDDFVGHTGSGRVKVEF